MNTLNEKLYYPKNVYYGIFGVPPNKAATLDSNAEELLESVLGTLLPQESEILMLRYKNDMTVQKIAENENLNEDEVSEIIDRTLRKLRHPSRSKILKNAMLFCLE